MYDGTVSSGMFSEEAQRIMAHISRMQSLCRMQSGAGAHQISCAATNPHTHMSPATSARRSGGAGAGGGAGGGGGGGEASEEAADKDVEMTVSRGFADKADKHIHVLAQAHTRALQTKPDKHIHVLALSRHVGTKKKKHELHDLVPLPPSLGNDKLIVTKKKTKKVESGDGNEERGTRRTATRTKKVESGDGNEEGKATSMRGVVEKVESGDGNEEGKDTPMRGGVVAVVSGASFGSNMSNMLGGRLSGGAAVAASGGGGRGGWSQCQESRSVIIQVKHGMGASKEERQSATRRGEEEGGRVGGGEYWCASPEPTALPGMVEGEEWQETGAVAGVRRGASIDYRGRGELDVCEEEVLKGEGEVWVVGCNLGEGDAPEKWKKKKRKKEGEAEGDKSTDKEAPDAEGMEASPNSICALQQVVGARGEVTHTRNGGSCGGEGGEGGGDDGGGEGGNSPSLSDARHTLGGGGHKGPGAAGTGVGANRYGTRAALAAVLQDMGQRWSAARNQGARDSQAGASGARDSAAAKTPCEEARKEECEGGVAVVVDEPVQSLEAQTAEHVGRGMSTCGVGGDLVGSQFVCDQGPFKGVAEVYMIRKCGGLIETLKRRGQLMERHLFLRSQLDRGGERGGEEGRLSSLGELELEATILELEETGHRLRTCEQKVRRMCVGGGGVGGRPMPMQGKARAVGAMAEQGTPLMGNAQEGKALMGNAQDVVGALVIFNSRFARDDCLTHYSLSTPDKACLDGDLQHLQVLPGPHPLFH